MNRDSVMSKLKGRKVVQWAVAYIATAWVIAQVAEVIAEPWGLPLHWIRILHTVLIAGLPLVFTLAWFHGERGHQRVQRAEAIILLLIAAGAWLSISTIDFGKPSTTPTADGRNVLDLVSDSVPRLAVLAFSNLGPAKDAYFADGVTAELGSRLSGLKGLALLSPSSAKAFKDSGQTPRQFGKFLGADYVLSGTVQWNRSGGNGTRIRVIPEVIRIADDTQVWSTHIDRSFEDALTIQEDIAIRVVEELSITMSKSERATIVSELTDNPLAYEAYLKGLQVLPSGHGAEADFRRARQLLQQAVTLDADFVEAWAALSDADKGLYWFGYDTSPSRLDSAKASIDQALGIDPGSQIARFHLADFYYRQRRYEEALKAFSELYRERPNDAVLMQYMGYLWRRQGLFEQGLESLERASRLDPLNSYLVLETAWTHMFVAHMDRAGELIRKARAADPSENWVYLIGAMYCWTAGGPEALSCSRSYLEQFPNPRSIYPAWFWMLQHLMEGHPRRAFNLIANFPEPALQMQALYLPVEQIRGQLLIALDRADEARPLLERAVEHLEARLAQNAGDFRLPAALALAHAHLGERTKAVANAGKALELMPLSRDTLVGTDVLYTVAEVYAVLGEDEMALDTMAKLHAVPSIYRNAWWTLNPVFANLTRHPRFQSLLQQTNFGRPE